jgi:hypothetical protein
MEARLVRSVFCTVLTLALFNSAWGAGYRTRNFAVSAPSGALAKEIGDAAERWRQALSVEWIGKEMPPWSQPCPIHAKVGRHLGAGGATSFIFDQGQVFGWRMNIQGSRQRILDSVLPHEVTHTIFACYFRQPLPRWADEGACTTVEHPSEIAKQERMLIDFLKQRRGIPFSQMLAMKDYPRDVLPLYSQGHSLAQMLLESRGKQAFLTFLKDGLKDENWPRAVKQHYGYQNLQAMQNSWLSWIKAGRPRLDRSPGLIASTAPAVRKGSVVRGQSPDDSSQPTGPSAPAAVNSVYAQMAAHASSDRETAR